MRTLRRKSAITLLFLITVMLAFSIISPIVAYADPTPAPDNYNDPSNVDVSFDADGKLVVEFPNQGKTSQDAWKNFIGKYKEFITGFAGIGAVTMIVFFIISFLKLGASVGNPNARSAALQGCLWTGIAAALLGSVTFIVGFFYNAL